MMLRECWMKKDAGLRDGGSTELMPYITDLKPEPPLLHSLQALEIVSQSKSSR